MQIEISSDQKWRRECDRAVSARARAEKQEEIRTRKFVHAEMSEADASELKAESNFDFAVLTEQHAAWLSFGLVEA